MPKSTAIANDMPETPVIAISSSELEQLDKPNARPVGWVLDELSDEELLWLGRS